MDLLDPQIDDFIESSESLLDESNLPDKDQQRIEHESELLQKRWNKVKNDANSRLPRFVNTTNFSEEKLPFLRYLISDFVFWPSRHAFFHL